MCLTIQIERRMLKNLKTVEQAKKEIEKLLTVSVHEEKTLKSRAYGDAIHT